MIVTFPLGPGGILNTMWWLLPLRRPGDVLPLRIRAQLLARRPLAAEKARATKWHHERVCAMLQAAKAASCRLQGPSGLARERIVFTAAALTKGRQRGNLR